MRTADVLITVKNPFEEPGADYLVLVNGEGQHSLWPAFAELPGGWRTVCGPTGRRKCLEFVEKHWTDMYPGRAVRTRPVS